MSPATHATETRGGRHDACEGSPARFRLTADGIVLPVEDAAGPVSHYELRAAGR